MKVLGFYIIWGLKDIDKGYTFAVFLPDILTMSMSVIVLTLFLAVMVGCINHVPCTDNVDVAAYDLAGRFLREYTPPGYRLIEYLPSTQTGRNPHRWICRYERDDNVYLQDCSYLTDVRASFKRDCPAGCEISQVAVTSTPTVSFIGVVGKLPMHKNPQKKAAYY